MYNVGTSVIFWCNFKGMEWSYFQSTLWCLVTYEVTSKITPPTPFHWVYGEGHSKYVAKV